MAEGLGEPARPQRRQAVPAVLPGGGGGLPQQQHGLFAWLVAQGYAGAADKNLDHRVEPTELFGYLQDAMAAAGSFETKRFLAGADGWDPTMIQ